MMQKFTLKARDTYLKRMVMFQDTEMIKVITGVRRCGKSSLMKLMVKHLLDTGIDLSLIHIFRLRRLHHRSATERAGRLRPALLDSAIPAPSLKRSALLRWCIGCAGS